MAQPERIEHLKVCEWLRQCHPEILFYHFANERKCSPQQGALLKRMGVIPGVSDLFFPKGNLGHKGLWIELKTLTGKPSKAQQEFIINMRKENYMAEICYGADEAIFAIKLFYGME